jgi:hypothetical protein
MSLMNVEVLTAVAVKIAVIGRDAVQSVRSILTFQTILLLPSSDYTASHPSREQSSECALFLECHV